VRRAASAGDVNRHGCTQQQKKRFCTNKTQKNS
jgi:hypothetical protein